jgi:hypothetical protein
MRFSSDFKQTYYLIKALKSRLVLPSRLLPLHNSIENTSADFIFLEDISPIPILRNKRSGRRRPRSSSEMVTCSTYKRNLEGSLKKRIFFSAWQTGNRKQKAPKELQRDYKSSGVPADAIEENGNQTEDVICT